MHDLLGGAVGQPRMKRPAEKAANQYLAPWGALGELHAGEARPQHGQAFASRHEESEPRQRAANLGSSIAKVHGRARRIREPSQLAGEVVIETLERFGDRVGGAGEYHGVGADDVVVAQ
jgi:hypothetical protein